jgi:hypothetical protein
MSLFSPVTLLLLFATTSHGTKRRAYRAYGAPTIFLNPKFNLPKLLCGMSVIKLKKKSWYKLIMQGTTYLESQKV